MIEAKDVINALNRLENVQSGSKAGLLAAMEQEKDGPQLREDDSDLNNAPRIMAAYHALDAQGRADVIAALKPEVAAEPVSEPEPKAEAKGSLPDDFPARAALDAGDVRTFHQLRKRIAEDTLTDIPGIGKPTAEKIVAALVAADAAVSTEGGDE